MLFASSSLFLSFVQVLVPFVLVPPKSYVGLLRHQHPVSSHHPFLLLLQHTPACSAPHEYLLVPGKNG